VVFSFFKKKGAMPPQRPRPAAGRPPAAQAPVPEYDVDPHHTVSGIEVSDSGEFGLSPLTEEAAILHANGRSEAAIELLLQGVSEPDGARRNPQTWFMLFDLFLLQGMRSEFDRLALDFAVEFERSAPIWRGGGAAEAQAAPRRREPHYALRGSLEADSRREIADLEELAGRDGMVKLDLGSLQGVDDAGCTLLGEAMQRMEALGRRVRLKGAENLEALLRAEIAKRGKSCARSVWLLLLRLYQMRGMHEEFESASLDYAVAYEVSPPSWEPSRAPPPDSPSGEYEVPAAAEAPADALALSGVLGGASPKQIGEILGYGAARSTVNVDMSGVSRVDFLAAGALLNAVIALSGAGKTVVIYGANEMIQALFAIVGVNRHATVARNKQH
jgi:ABC-type transporter Mla MlaB component